MFGTTTATMKSFLTIFAFMHLARSQTTTSLIMPGFDPQPFIGDIIGTDSQSGRTTWAIRNGAVDATFLAENQFPGVATLIQGPDYVSMNYQFNIDLTLPGPGPGPANVPGQAPESLAVECTLTQTTIGSCSGAAFGTPVSASPTTFTPFPVLIGSTTTTTTSAPITTSAPTSSMSTSTTTTVVYSTTPMATPSNTNAVNATETKTKNPNGAVGIGIGIGIGGNGLISIGMGVGVYIVASFFGYVL